MALDLFMFADITGQNGLFLNMLDMASHFQVVFPVADKNPLTVFYGFLLGRCLTLGVPWEVSLNRPSVNWLSKLDVGSCQRPQCRRPRTLHVNVRTTSGGPIFGQRERFFDKTVALCSLELVNEHIDRRQWAQSMSMGAWSIFASPFSALISCVTISISPKTP